MKKHLLILISAISITTSTANNENEKNEIINTENKTQNTEIKKAPRTLGQQIIDLTLYITDEKKREQLKVILAISAVIIGYLIYNELKKSNYRYRC